MVQDVLSNAFEKNGTFHVQSYKEASRLFMNEPEQHEHTDEACPKIATWRQLVLQKDEWFNLFATKSGSLSCKLSFVISNCSATFSHPPVLTLSHPHLRKARTPRTSSAKDKPKRMTQQTSQEMASTDCNKASILKTGWSSLDLDANPTRSNSSCLQPRQYKLYIHALME